MSTFSEKPAHQQPPLAAGAAGELSISIKTIQNIAFFASLSVLFVVCLILALRNWKRTLAYWLRAFAQKTTAAAAGSNNSSRRRRDIYDDDDYDDVDQDGNDDGDGGDPPPPTSSRRNIGTRKNNRR